MKPEPLGLVKAILAELYTGGRVHGPQFNIAPMVRRIIIYKITRILTCSHQRFTVVGERQ
jgi:hypothetical protein